jgi:hypothetical protein
MKITKTYLRQVIKEELAAVMEGVVVDFEARRKERDERKIPVRRWAQPILDKVLATDRGKKLLDRLAADPKGEKDTEGHSVLQRLAADLEGKEDTEGHSVLQTLGHDEQQLNWVLFNVINAWRERKGEE